VLKIQAQAVCEQKGVLLEAAIDLTEIIEAEELGRYQSDVVVRSAKVTVDMGVRTYEFITVYCIYREA